MIKYNKWLFLIVSVFLLITLTIAEAKQKEKYYQDIHCDSLGGQVEYKLEDKTRIDCLTNKRAIEYDFATKWAECAGQAIYYAEKINIICDNLSDNEKKQLLFSCEYKRKPVCALIGTEKQFKRYIPRIETINKNLINKIEIIKIDQ
jgi:hypothetical protein